VLIRIAPCDEVEGGKCANAIELGLRARSNLFYDVKVKVSVSVRVKAPGGDTVQ
jgi:hypothetical protein